VSVLSVETNADEPYLAAAWLSPNRRALLLLTPALLSEGHRESDGKGNSKVFVESDHGEREI